MSELDAASEPDEPRTEPPVLRVVRGDATPEELAALVTVLMARARVRDRQAGRTTGSATPASDWANRSRLLRRSPHPGPGAWRDSGRPAP